LIITWTNLYHFSIFFQIPDDIFYIHVIGLDFPNHLETLKLKLLWLQCHLASEFILPGKFVWPRNLDPNDYTIVNDIVLIAPSVSARHYCMSVRKNCRRLLDMQLNIQKSVCIRFGARFRVSCKSLASSFGGVVD